MEHGVYTRYATIPYALERVPGARHLLVTFSALTVGSAPPLTQVARHIGDLRAHRLYVGADEEFLIGPNLERAGMRTAAHLIWREAERLGVAEGDVIAFGSSYRAIMALTVGLEARAGLVVAGAPIVRIGSWIKRLNLVLPPNEDAGQIRRALLALTRVDEDEHARDFLDRMVDRAVNRATHAGTIELYVSPGDPVHDQVAGLAERIAAHPTLTCRLTREDYGDHAGIRDPFYAFVRRTVGDRIDDLPL